MRPIEQERDWELAARRQSRANLLKWVLVAIAVAIVVVLALVRAAPSQVAARHPIWQTGARAELSPEILKLIETHCVAVLITKQTYAVQALSTVTLPHVDYDYKDGQRFAHIPEQLLNLRCE